VHSPFANNSSVRVHIAIDSVKLLARASIVFITSTIETLSDKAKRFFFRVSHASMLDKLQILKPQRLTCLCSEFNEIFFFVIAGNVSSAFSLRSLNFCAQNFRRFLVFFLKFLLIIFVYFILSINRQPRKMDEKTEIRLVDFEDALKMCGFGKFNYILILLGGGLLGCSYIDTTAISLVLPIAQCDLNLSSSDKGILGAIGYVGVLLSAHLWGFLSDTKGRRKTIIPSLLMASLSSFISSFSFNFWMLVVTRFLNGYL
jgi:hypothetical protein